MKKFFLTVLAVCTAAFVLLGVCACTTKKPVEQPPQTVAVESVTLDKTTATLDIGGTLTLTATVLPENATDKTVSWSSSDEAVATVVNGVVTAKAAGTATITVTTADGSKTATCAMTVNQPAPVVIKVESVTLDKTTATLNIDDTLTLTATVLPENATDKTVSWKSSDDAVATVVNGKVTAKAAGTATITVTTTDGSKTATCAVTVNKPAPVVVNVESVTLDKTAETLEIDCTVTLAATVLPENATDKTLSWSSSNEAVATVVDGVVTAKAAGSATITVTTKDGSKTAICAVTVNQPAPVVVNVESVTLDKTTATLDIDGTVTLAATVLPENATDKSVSWSSSNEAVATVVDGVVTAKAAGTATITVTTTDESKTAECVITVNEPAPVVINVESVTLDKTTATLEIDGTVTLTATVLPENATDKTVSWSSSNEAVATVVNGKVTAKAAGTATITVTTTDGSKTATCAVTVNEPAPVVINVESVTLDKTTATLNINDILTLTATVLPENATDKSVSWSSSDEAVAIVVDGKVTAKAAGTATITVTTTDGSKTAICAVTVNEPAPVIINVESVALDKTTATLNINDTLTLTATVLPANATDKSVSWKSSNEAVATVVNGKVTAKAAGTATITVTTADGSKTAECAITVNEPAPVVINVESVTLDKTTATLNINDTLTLTATVLPANATDKSVSWSSEDESILTVLNGVVTAKKAGRATITVTTTDGNKTADCVITVNETQALTLSYTYAGNECAAFEWSDGNAAGAKVQYKLTTETNYSTVDKDLVRQTANGVARADIVGLKGGAKYDFKVISSSGKEVNVTLTVNAYDRSGYAHFNYTSGVGAYNDDGTPKANAQIIYVSEATKNSVKATINGKTYTGIVPIMGGLSNSKNPVIIRVIGTIGAATWNKIDYNADKKYNSQHKVPASVIVGINGKQLPTNSNISQADLISDGYNTLNTSVYSELKGLDSRAKYSSGEYDTIWNNCSIQNAKNVTLEGIGEGARLFQWGLTWKTCNSIEVRNLTFEDYTEDACSFEGGSESTTAEGFNSKHIWLHHNTFEEGMNYWDLTAEQDKHEGDGATDFKKLAYLTTSYNVHHKNHKTGLVGGGDSTTTACITFHHNYYNGNSSRLPLGRKANMHMYNNYYLNTTNTDLSIRAKAYAFVENCYFSNNNRPVELQYNSSKESGSAKLVNCVINQNRIYVNSNIKTNNLYVGNDRGATVYTENTYGTTFDTNPSQFYYDAAAAKTNVTHMLKTADVPTVIPQVAGAQRRGGNVALANSGNNAVSGTSSGEGPVTPDPEPVDYPTYSQLLARADKIFAEDFSSYADGARLAEFQSYNTAGLYSQPDSTQGYENSHTEVKNGATHQVTNVGVSDVKTNGKNTTTVWAFGQVTKTVEGYFEINTTDIGSKWDIIKFVSGSSNLFAVRIDTDKAKALTYTVAGGTAVTPQSSFVWKAKTTYKVYFKIDLAAGKITLNITDGTLTFNVEALSANITSVSGISFVSSNNGQRLTSLDNMVVCGS